MYSLQSIINNRRLVHFELETNPASAKNYIIEMPALVPFDLIQINKKAMLKSFEMHEHDVVLNNCSFDVALHNDVLNIKISPSKNTFEPVASPKIETENIDYTDLEDLDLEEEKPTTSVPIEGNQESLIQLGIIEGALNIFCRENDKLISVQAKCVKELATITLTQTKLLVQIEYVPTQLKASCYLHLAHPNQFLGVALDFGSEASQMAVKRYSTDTNLQEKAPEIENLYRNVYAYHVTKKMLPRDNSIQYYQEDRGTKFYKSLFFAKKELAGDYDVQRTKKSLCEAPTNLKMMVNTKGRENDEGGISSLIHHYHQLPNLKIVHQHHDILASLHFDMDSARGQAELSLGEVKGYFNNTILRTLIASFLHTDFIKFPDEKRFLRLVLLVPNIYDNNDVQNAQQNLDELLAELKEDEFSNLACWEVTTISESDASFVGYLGKNNHTIATNKDYIIIDVGKGTTDFSIVRTGADSINNIEPIYRNGFAGGGNLLTFSVFETLLHFMREECDPNDNIIKYLQDKIVGTLRGDDLLNKTLFYNEIERLKFNFKSGNVEAIREQWSRAKVTDTSFGNLIENNIDFSEFIKLLQELSFGADFYNYVQDACNAIIEKTVSYLKLVSDNKKDFDLAGVLLTGRTFLFKPLADAMKERIKMEFKISDEKIHQLEGAELKDICIKGVFNNSVKVNTDVIGYPIQLFNKEEVKEKGTEKIKKKWSLKAIILNDLERFTRAEKHLVADQKLNAEKLAHSQLLIGSKYYSVVDNGLLPIETHIDFTSRGYIIRQLQNGLVKNITALSPIHDYDGVDLTLIVPSLFPNYMDEQYMFSLQSDAIQSRWKGSQTNVESTLPVNVPPTIPMNTTNIEPENPLLF